MTPSPTSGVLVRDYEDFYRPGDRGKGERREPLKLQTNGCDRTKLPVVFRRFIYINTIVENTKVNIVFSPVSIYLELPWPADNQIHLLLGQ